MQPLNLCDIVVSATCITPSEFRHKNAYKISLHITIFMCVFLISHYSEVRSSLIYNTSARYERHECQTSDTSGTRVRHERHECNTQVQHKGCTNDTSATRVLHERYGCDTNEKNLILIITQIKTYFHIPLFTIWQVKDYKKRNNFILSTTFGNASFPWQNVFEKSTTKIGLCNDKSYIKNLYTRLLLEIPSHVPA